MGMLPSSLYRKLARESMTFEELQKCLDVLGVTIEFELQYPDGQKLPGVRHAKLNHCIVSSSVMTEILYEKYFKGVPLNRQENMWRDLGLIITRKDMAHWTNRICEEWLQPLVDVFHKTMLEECRVIHADETRIQCNHEPGRKAHTDSFMWVLVSGAQEQHHIVLFHYTMTRNGDHARNLLKGWHGSLVTDAYVGYDKVEDITHGLCWSHLRRKYIDSIPLDSGGKEIPGSKGAEARAMVDQLFHIEGLLKDLQPRERLKQRQGNLLMMAHISFM